MKTHILLLTVLFCFIIGNTSAQEEDTKIDTNKEAVYSGGIAELLNSKTFEFIANMVYPTSGAPKSLVGSGYSVTYSPNMIISNLPFFGRAYGGTTMGRDTGMRFEGKPESFSVEKKKEYQINTIVRDGETFEMSLSVSNSGNATLNISSNKRGTISFQGEVVGVE